MMRRFLLAAVAATVGLGAPASAHVSGHVTSDYDTVSGGGSSHLPGYLQCVPYARAVSGIQIYGDAHTWWKQAEGHYARGFTPKVGAVMAFHPHGKMVLGHVATVSRILNGRMVMLRHANWSPINGQRGQIEKDVMALDVSPNNDWSAVRVWFDPIQALGSTAWPVDGFIYNHKPTRNEHGRMREDNANDPIGAIIAAFSKAF